MSQPKLARLTLKPGERVFREGDEADAAYIIESGSIEISKSVQDDSVVIGVIPQGEMFGEMALIDDQPRSGTARAVEPTVIATIPRATFQQRLERTDPVIRQLLNLLIRRLRSQTETTVRKSTVVR